MQIQNIQNTSADAIISHCDQRASMLAASDHVRFMLLCRKRM